MIAEPRVVTDPDGIRWTCVQAFAGLGNDEAKQDAARVAGTDLLQVVCTPSGDARSRRLQLRPDWEAMSDDDLVAAIADAAE